MIRKISVLGILAILVLAIAIAGWIWLSGRNKGPLNAATILPADTLILLEARDVRSLGKRLNQTAVFHFFKEPEIARIVAPLRAKADPLPSFKALSTFGSEARVEHVFVAQVAAGEGIAMIGGFESGVGSSALPGHLKKLHEMLGAAFDFDDQPARRHNRHAILRGAFGRLAIELVVVKNRCYFATAPVVLDGFLDRLDRFTTEGVAPDSLASAKDFREAVSVLPAEWDARLTMQPQRWAAFGADSTWLAGLLQTPKNLPRTAVLTSKIDSKIFRDALYIPGDFAKDWPVLSPDAPGFRSTALDIRLSIDAVIAARELPVLQWGKVPMVEEIERHFWKSHITREQWVSAFGPEVRLAVLWPKGSGMPVFELTCRVRQEGKAREIFSRLGDEIAASADVRREVVQNKEVILVPTGESLLYTPAMMLEPDRLRIVSNVADFGLIERERAAGDNSTKSLTTRSAKTKPDENLVSVHVDSALLAGRTYQLFRPVLALTSRMLPNNQRRSFDWTQLPDVEVVTRNLQPMDVVLRRVGDGVLMESSGSLTLPQGLAAFWAIQSRMNR